jgi:hypothetical protein
MYYKTLSLSVLIGQIKDKWLDKDKKNYLSLSYMTILYLKYKLFKILK